MKRLGVPPLSTPTRVTLLTGQYPFRHGWSHHYDVPLWGGEGLSWTKFEVFARVLRDSGYATAVGGRWQLNDLEKQPDALNQHGFDEHCVWVNAEEESGETDGRRWHSNIMTNGRRSSVSDGPDTINSFLVDFVAREREKPFLVYYSMLLTSNRPALINESDYAGNVTYMDKLVGKLVDGVDKAGLAHNTMIVLTSDNGSAVAGNLNGLPFETGKGAKADFGAHVPFIVRAPFLTSKGRVSRDLIDFTDLYPTFLELAKTVPPNNVTLDGRSIVPSLLGSEDPFEKRNWIFSQLGSFRMIRDWQHVVDNQGNFHDLTKDRLQQKKVSPLDKIAPGRRQRLEAILNRFPSDGPAPFPEYEDRFGMSTDKKSACLAARLAKATTNSDRLLGDRTL